MNGTTNLTREYERRSRPAMPVTAIKMMAFQLTDPSAFDRPLIGLAFGGPFRDIARTSNALTRVKMAAEIDLDADMRVDLEDFGVPEYHVRRQFDLAILGAEAALREGSTLGVGCMGGTGRTGMFLGCLLRHIEQDPTPVETTRARYKAHAIETPEQEAFVRGYAVDPEIAATWRATALALETHAQRATEAPASPWAVNLGSRWGHRLKRLGRAFSRFWE